MRRRGTPCVGARAALARGTSTPPSSTTSAPRFMSTATANPPERHVAVMDWMASRSVATIMESSSLPGPSRSSASTIPTYPRHSAYRPRPRSHTGTASSTRRRHRRRRRPRAPLSRVSPVLRARPPARQSLIPSLASRRLLPLAGSSERRHVSRGVARARVVAEGGRLGGGPSPCLHARGSAAVAGVVEA